MKQTAKLFFIGLVFTCSSCFETEEFPNVPQISFNSLRYVDTDVLDSLVVSFNFQDGDGDIGLGNNVGDLSSPYQIFDVIIDSEDSIVTISKVNIELPLFRAPVRIEDNNGEPAYLYFPQDKQPFSDTDNRPSYGCNSYEIIQEDTFFVARNEFHFNFHIQFLEKSSNDSDFTPIDFEEIFNRSDCSLGNFDGRIPVFDPNGKEGTITYAMLSRAFTSVFLDDSIKLEFYIYDRALRKSNTITSSGFTLQGLLTSPLTN